jgi:hypothetical protein
LVIYFKYYIFRVCVCNLIYPAFKAHAPYYSRSWSVRFYHILPHYLKNCKILGQKSLEKRVLISCIILSETFLILKITLGDITINVHKSSLLLLLLLLLCGGGARALQP